MISVKIEMLRPNKIKIVINSDDLSKWGVSADAVAKNSPETREMFLSLLRQAEEETGFYCNNSRLVVEATASTSGELTIFVTKVDSAEEKALFDKISAVNHAEIIRKKAPSAERKRPVKTLIELETLDDVITFCYAYENYYGGSLYLYDDVYYMSVDSALIPYAAEFGTERSSKKRLLVEEHGKPIAKENAFYIIRNKFSAD